MIYEKRGSWCFRDANDRLHKFKTKEEAEKAAGIVPVVEVNDGVQEEKEAFEEEEERGEEADADE